MIESIFNTLTELLYQNFLLAIISAFGWGILSIILSPCHLSSIPLIIGYLNTQESMNAKRTALLSLIFSLGIFFTISIIGVITLVLGRIMGDIGVIGNYAVAAIFFIIGLYFLNIIKLNWLGIHIPKLKIRGLPTVFLLGLIFGMGLGPCTFAFMAPVLGVVFDTSSKNPPLAISLVASFALGHCLIIIAAGTLFQFLQGILNWNANSPASEIIRKICGILIIAGGIYFIFVTF